MYVSTYIYTQQLSPTFLMASKFGVKLRLGNAIFKITVNTRELWNFRFQTCHFFSISSSVLNIHPFFQKFQNPT